MKNYSYEYVDINGAQHYFLHYPAKSNVVLLFLHGGPGSSEVFFSYTTQGEDPTCSFVYYDQRGTGKTWLKNKTVDTTFEMLIDDLHAVIQYTKEKYKTDKIILLGHSWGSVLGIEYVKRYAKDVVAYIGMGQVVNTIEGESMSYEKLGEIIKAEANSKSIKIFNSIKGYPQNVDVKKSLKPVITFRKLQGKHGIGMMADFWKLMRIVLKSPVFSIRDLLPLINGSKYNMELLEYMFSYSTTDYIQYNVPMFYICGENDLQVPSVLVENYFEKIEAPQKALFWVEKAGHMPDIDNPKSYNIIVKEIINKLNL